MLYLDEICCLSGRSTRTCTYGLGGNSFICPYQNEQSFNSSVMGWTWDRECTCFVLPSSLCSSNSVDPRVASLKLSSRCIIQSISCWTIQSWCDWTYTRCSKPSCRNLVTTGVADYHLLRYTTLKVHTNPYIACLLHWTHHTFMLLSLLRRRYKDWIPWKNTALQSIPWTNRT